MIVARLEVSKSLCRAANNDKGLGKLHRCPAFSVTNRVQLILAEKPQALLVLRLSFSLRIARRV